MAYHLAKHRRRTIRITRTRDLALTVLTAEQQGIFKRHNINIDYVDVPYARKGMELLLEGQVDMAIMPDILFAYMGFLNPKDPVKCIASVEKRNPGNIIILQKDAAPDDLVDQNIGFAPRSTSYSFLTLFLKKHRISKQRVTLTPLSPQVLPNALIRREISAMSLWEPHISNTLFALDQLGMPYTHFKNLNLYTSEVVLCTSKTSLIKNRLAFLNILKALKEAEIFLSTNKNLAYEALSQKIRVAGKRTHEALEAFHPALNPVSADFLLTIDMLADMIAEEDTAFHQNAKPDYADFIDNSLFLDIFTEKM